MTVCWFRSRSWTTKYAPARNTSVAPAYLDHTFETSMNKLARRLTLVSTCHRCRTSPVVRSSKRSVPPAEPAAIARPSEVIASERTQYNSWSFPKRWTTLPLARREAPNPDNARARAGRDEGTFGVEVRSPSIAEASRKACGKEIGRASCRERVS